MILYNTKAALSTAFGENGRGGSLSSETVILLLPKKQDPENTWFSRVLADTHGVIRTPDLPLRRRPLYPAELRGQVALGGSTEGTDPCRFCFEKTAGLDSGHFRRFSENAGTAGFSGGCSVLRRRVPSGPTQGIIAQNGRDFKSSPGICAEKFPGEPLCA